MANETRKLAEFVSNNHFEDLPLSVVNKAKVVMIDTLSCAVAGYTKSKEECDLIINFVKSIGGNDQSTIWFDGYKTSAMMAALANSTMAHTVDFDDTHLDSVAHLGAGLLGTVISLGEKNNAPGKDIITAFVMGFEIGARVGNSVNKGKIHHHYKYWHPTATAGTIGCAAAAAKLLGLDESQTEQAIGLGVDQAAGFRYCIDAGDFSKSLHPGWSSLRGIMAAEIIALGAIGPKGLLEYPTGFCTAMCSEPNIEELNAGLGVEYEILKDSLKMYPTIHGSHTSIEATLNILKHNKIDYNEIDNILVRMSPLAKGQGANYHPDSILAARLSIPFSISIAIHRGQVTLDDFTEDLLEDPNNLEFMKKVIIQPDPNLNNEYPKSGFVGEVTITMKDNKQYKDMVIYPKDHPERPATDEDIKSKYYSLATNTWTKLKAEKIYNIFNILESYDNIKNVINEFQV